MIAWKILGFCLVCYVLYKIWKGLGLILPSRLLADDEISKMFNNIKIEVTNLNDPINDEELRGFYIRYLNKKADDDRSQWTTEPALTFEVYKENAEKDYTSPRYYANAMCASAFIGGMDGNPPQMIHYH